MIKVNIDVTKIPKDKLFKGKKGTYLNAVLIDKPDQYDNDGFIAMDRTKEEREANEQSAIIGNWKHIGAKPAAKPKPTPQPTRRAADPDLDPEDTVPF